MLTWESTISNRGTYGSWIRYFEKGRGKDSSSGSGNAFVLIILVVLLSAPEDGLTSFVFPSVIPLAKGRRLALALLYLGSLFHRLNQCANNIVRYIGRYDG